VHKRPGYPTLFQRGTRTQNMIFRALNIYRICDDNIDPVKLNSFLQQHAWSPCLPSQEKSAGFDFILGLKQRVFTENRCHFFRLTVEEKLLPSSAVRMETKSAIEKQAKSLGRKLTRTERQIIQDETRQKMILKAFSRISHTWAYIDTAEKLLVINTTSQKDADGIAQLMKGASSSKSIYPLKPQHDTSAKLTFWLSEDQAPEPFEVGLKCEIGDGEGTIKYNKILLDDDSLRKYLRSDMAVSSLSLSLSDQLTFVLTSDFLIKEFSLTESALEELDKGSGTALELESGEFKLMTEKVRILTRCLLNVLGGEESSP
jgi:recombination associated protein RdgC